MGKAPWDLPGPDIILAEGARQALEIVGPPRSLWEAASGYPLSLGPTAVKILGFTGEEGLGREREREPPGC